MSAGRDKAAPAPERFALRYFILCDDARLELSRKLTLVGVYTDVVFTAKETTQFPQLSFVFSFTRLTDELPRSGTFRLEGPKGVMFQETGFSIGQLTPEFRTTNMTIHAGGLTLSVGDYRAVFTVNDSTEFVGEFSVRHDPKAIAAILSETPE